MDLTDRIGRRMTLKDLHVFVAVVQAGSMGKAAQRLHSSQPAISRSIAGLEHALGIRLLERTPQGVEPTEYGRALLEGGRGVFDQLRQTLGRIGSLADPATGEVRVGSTVVTAATFVCTVIDRVSRRHRRSSFHLVTAAWEALHAELAERRVDLLITRNFGRSLDSRFDFERLYDESFVVAAGNESPWARRRKVSLRDLLDEPWVLPPPESAISAVAREAFAARGLDYPRATVVALTPEVRMSLLATGRFITLFPASTVRFSARRHEIKVLPVELDTPPVPSGIVTLRDRDISPAARLFIATARDVAKSRAA